jgi:hypothetical protein
MKIETTLQLTRLDKDFAKIETRRQPSRSWLKHFFDLLYEPLGYKVNNLANIPDIGAANRALAVTDANNMICNLFIGAAGGNFMSFIPNSGSTNGYVATYINGGEFGIVVGTDDTAVTPTDNALVTIAAHGSGAGQLLYSGVEILAPTFADPNGSMVIRRYFTNASGGDIVVEEVGIYSPGFNASPNAYLFCILRDVVSPGVTVADTEILAVTYTVQITV